MASDSISGTIIGEVGVYVRIELGDYIGQTVLEICACSICDG